MALDLKNLSVRTFSGAVYIGLLIGAIVLGTTAIAILMAVFAVLATYELEGNALKADNPDRWYVPWIVDAAALASLQLSVIFSPYHTHAWFFLAFVCLLCLRFIMQIFIPEGKPLKSIAIAALEVLYIGLPLYLLSVAVSFIHNPWIVVCALAMIWINDTGAYLVGCSIGKHKMFPRLSPKKSWEGFFGGLLFNIGAAFIFFYCFHLDQFEFISNVQGWIFIGICVTVFATLGDLFESMLKRSLGIKDFGNIIPGHGGILDRIDSLLFVVPMVMLLISIASIAIVVN